LPSAFVAAVRDAPVSRLLTVTVAPLMGLPEASSTLPEIDADTCPQAEAAMRAADQRRGGSNNRLRCAAFTALFSLSSSGQGHGRGVPGIFVLQPQPAMISVTFEPPPQKSRLERP